jgi:hypothetical protein
MANGGAGIFDEERPIVPLDQLVALIEGAFEGARFLGVKPKGWLPDGNLDQAGRDGSALRQNRTMKHERQ